MKMIKRIFNWYCEKYSYVYRPMIEAGINPNI